MRSGINRLTRDRMNERKETGNSQLIVNSSEVVGSSSKLRLRGILTKVS